VAVFSPAVTLVVYAIQAQIRGVGYIDVNKAFTSLAIIGMVSAPATTILVLMPNFAALLAAFDRIQKYLLSPDREDKRESLDKRYTNGSNGQENGTAYDHADGSNAALLLDHATVRPAATADPVLKDISAKMQKGTLIVCSGTVGSGKTTLARALLGDLPPDAGSIKTAFGTIAYCAQTAWLINGTIKDNIKGPPGGQGEFDEEWYKRVVHACDLEEDLDQLPDGDETVVGSRGITLSGGQKQRVVGYALWSCRLAF
jgi:ATP-binding cassette, subfamily C (CFTR/MRP), member 1